LLPVFPLEDDGFRLTIETAMESLPEEQRSVLHLKLWEDLTFSQIGETLEISPQTAASRYRYALDKLRDLLRPVYEERR
jgi:RNA polymerase sigma-70 factor (ECF subfamily)